MPVDSRQKSEKPDRKKVVKKGSQLSGSALPESSNSAADSIVSANTSTAGYNADEAIFALDIGTRTVVGVVGIQEKEIFRVLAVEVVEHKNRAMMDGQIHNIAQVADAAGEVREKLEKSTGISLTKVAIAAAGRVLKTCEMTIEREIEEGKEIDKDLISSIEMEAIQKAQLKLDEEVSQEEKTQFYCVGYSVINYYLNGFVISSLSGHKGKKAGVCVLATFLPHVVVDSLYTVMSRIGLEVASLTLEPIAAINVTIPKDLRLLNLALVDIGAGTSDIAITKDGSVIAYAMVPIAGDEVTEKIAQNYLVDFNTGERIKVSITSGKDNISFVDVLGTKHTVKTVEVLEFIKPSVEYLAKTISQKILEYNHKSPNAVFLIGGGSQIPGLTEAIAGYLSLPLERVAVRGRGMIKNVKLKGKKLSGPEAITPLGIAVTAQLQKGQDFISVTINGKKISLFNSRKLMVADALILTGYSAEQLIGRSGKNISFELNGIRKTVKGEYGTAAEILVNSRPASLETVLEPGDGIWITPAIDGKDAEVLISDFISEAGKFVIYLNGNRVSMDAEIYLNEKATGIDSKICDGDVVTVSGAATLHQFLEISEIEEDKYDVLVNGSIVSLDYRLKAGDEVKCIKKQYAGKAWAYTKSIPESVEADMYASGKESLEMDSQNMSTKQNNNYINITVNGKPVLLNGEKSQYIFVDVFSYINFDLSKPQGTIVLKLNGKQAAFTDAIKPGDVVEIYWEH